MFINRMPLYILLSENIELECTQKAHMEIPDIPDFRSFIVLSNMNAIVKSSVFQCLNLHPTQET